MASFITSAKSQVIQKIDKPPIINCLRSSVTKKFIKLFGFNRVAEMFASVHSGYKVFSND